MLAAGYQRPTARSAAVNVASSGPSTRSQKPASAPARPASNGNAEVNVKCEKAPWIRVSDFTGLAVPFANAELLTPGFLSHTRLGSVQASYTFTDRFTALGGLDYQSFLGLGNVSFLRGTAPIADDEADENKAN